MRAVLKMSEMEAKLLMRERGTVFFTLGFR